MVTSVRNSRGLVDIKQHCHYAQASALGKFTQHPVSLGSDLITPHAGNLKLKAETQGHLLPLLPPPLSGMITPHPQP